MVFSSIKKKRNYNIYVADAAPQDLRWQLAYASYSREAEVLVNLLYYIISWDVFCSDLWPKCTPTEGLPLMGWKLNITNRCTCLIHLGRVTHICLSKVTIIGSDDYLNQCWYNVKWALGNKLQWNLNQSLHIFVQENALENVSASVCYADTLQKNKVPCQAII